MRIRETLTLRGVENSTADYIRVLSPGFPFESSGLSLVLHQDYRPGAREEIEHRLEAAGLRPKLSQSIYPEFDDADYARASLLDVAFPDLSMSGTSFVVKCDVCGTRRTERNHDRRFPEVRSTLPLLSVNGSVDIMSFTALERLRAAGLRGLEPRAFDQDERYSYLVAQSDLGELILHPEETKAYRGRCSVCDRPLFEVHFGPFRFAKKRWSGDDFVWAELIDRAVVSQRAYTQMVSLGARVTKLGPIVLE